MSSRPPGEGGAAGAGRPCLVTGASGFIGGALVEQMCAQGRPVRALARATSDTRRLEEHDVEIAVGDLSDPPSLAAAAAGAETVVHCAAMVSDWATVAEIAAVNVTGTKALHAAAAAAGVRRFVHISSTDVYGHPGRGPVDERHRAAGFANWYAETKRLAEEQLAGTGGPELVVLRPATVYGPGSREVIGEIARAIRGGHMLLIDRGRTLAGLCQIENLLDAIELALDHPAAAGEAFNVADGCDVSWRVLTDDLAAGLGCRGPRLSLPYPVAAAIGRGMEEGYRLLRRATGLRTAALLSRQAVQVLGIDQDFSTAKLRGLGWEPQVSYEEGLAATLQWLREEFLAQP